MAVINEQMTREQFQYQLARAKAFAKYPPPPTVADYWIGYCRGLRRAYHGDNFGTHQEHELWLSLSQSDDEFRRERGRGYEAAFWQYGSEADLPTQKRTERLIS